MKEYVRIAVPLSQEEFLALRQCAEYEYRHPREQARYLLRAALLGNVSPTNDNTGALIVTDNRAGAAQ
jgi:hypothetical protein